MYKSFYLLMTKLFFLDIFIANIYFILFFIQQIVSNISLSFKYSYLILVKFIILLLT
jgi:hypothetical protein